MRVQDGAVVNATTSDLEEQGSRPGFSPVNSTIIKDVRSSTYSVVAGWLSGPLPWNSLLLPRVVRFNSSTLALIWTRHPWVGPNWSKAVDHCPVTTISAPLCDSVSYRNSNVKNTAKCPSSEWDLNLNHPFPCSQCNSSICNHGANQLAHLQSWRVLLGHVVTRWNLYESWLGLGPQSQTGFEHWSQRKY